MEIVLASRNKKKAAELKKLLGELCGGINVLSLDDTEFAGDIVEDGSSFVENAIIKASTPASLGYIGVADDSGLCVDALGGNPGIYSARYSPEGTDSANNEKLLRELSGVLPCDRGAAFVCCVACVVPESFNLELEFDEGLSAFASLRAGKAVRAFCTWGECRGEILDAPRGEGGFGYDPLFYVPTANKTFSQLSDDEKNKISHRGIAMRAFAQILRGVE